MSDSAVNLCMENNFLISPDLDEKYITSEFINWVKKLDNPPLIIDLDIYNCFKKESRKVVVLPEKKRDGSVSSVKVVKSFGYDNNKKDMNDWFDYYTARFDNLKSILENRNELTNIMGVDSIKKNRNNNSISSIGLVKSLHTTNKGNIFFKLEDPSGVINCIILSKNDELMRESENMVNDEVVGISGNFSNNFFFVSNIVFPDIPNHPVKKSPVEEYACFISDTHVGSIDFEENTFNHFIKWLKGKNGNSSQKNISKKVKYLFVLGDLVDGVGVYPDQDKELVIKDIYKQYEVFAEYFKDLPDDIQVIVIPGNHDALRTSEPQPPLFKDISAPVFDINNVNVVSNPSLVNIGARKGFPGIDVMMYHGFSYTYYASNVPSLLDNGMDSPDKISKFLIKKRHLAPVHGSGLITPSNIDPFIIDPVPDVLATGHIHSLGISNYRGINLVAASCFQSMTSFMKKLGHHPTPGRVPLLNLKSRKIKVVDFK